MGNSGYRHSSDDGIAKLQTSLTVSIPSPICVSAASKPAISSRFQEAVRIKLVGRTLLVTPQLLSAFGNDAVICASFCKRIRILDNTNYRFVPLASTISGRIRVSARSNSSKFNRRVSPTSNGPRHPENPASSSNRGAPFATPEALSPLMSQIATLGFSQLTSCDPRCAITEIGFWRP